MTTPDEFAQSFDAIEIARAPSPTAIEAARPGFYLADDAGGRFVVDREFGVVSLRDDALLATEHGEVHEVQLRVVETTGESYVLDLKLRVTGLVPQMVGAEDFGFGDTGATATPVSSPAPIVPWCTFSPVCGRQAAETLVTEGAYGRVLATLLPPSNERITISFGERIPAPAPMHALWTI